MKKNQTDHHRHRHYYQQQILLKEKNVKIGSPISSCFS